MKNIRKLYIPIRTKYYKVIVQKLCILFPNIERLRIAVRCMESIEIFIHTLNTFPNLHYLSFSSFTMATELEKILDSNQNSIIHILRRPSRADCTCRLSVCYTARPTFNINWWINVKVNR